MHRIDTKTAQKDKFGAGKNGFTRGNPQTGTPAPIWMMTTLTCCRKNFVAWWRPPVPAWRKGGMDQLLTALRALLLSRKNPFGDIKSDGTVQTALENLGLGEAAKRDVGTGDNQIPDMGAFASGSGWFRLPGGYIVQFGTFSGKHDPLYQWTLPYTIP